MMLLSNINDVSKYDFHNEKFERAYKYLRSNDLKALECGTIDLGEGVLIKVQNYTTEPSEQRKYETHSHHFDIHYVIEGEEFIGLCPAEGLVQDGEYLVKEDMTFFKTPDVSGGVVLRDNDFVIVSPEVAHQPSCIASSACEIKKIVVKVEL